MKRSLFVTALAMLVALAFVATDASAVSRSGSNDSKGSKTKTVQVREIAVKSSPSYMSSSAGTLTYGTKVTIQSEEGNWYYVTTDSGQKGYIPQNVVGRSAASVDASKSYAAKGVTHDETALAGKGFNPQVEGQYKRSSASLAAAYTQVDRVERMKVSDASLRSFITQGKLNQ